MTQAPDNKPGDYFVSVISDAGHYRLLAGPFVNDHAAALAAVSKARAIAYELDPKAPWYKYGTCRLELESGALGILNDRMQL